MIANNKTPRHMLLLALLLTLLVACGASGQAEPSGASGSATSATEASAAEESSSAETRIFVNADGSEIELPANPQRVVALSEQDMDAALALVAPVVGVVNGRGAMEPPRYLQDRLAGVASVGSFAEPSLEAILALNPDLILLGGLFPELEAQLPALQEIAPVAVSYKSGDPWQDSFVRIADALNKSDEAQAWLADYETRVTAVKEAIAPNATAEVSIVRFNPDGPVVMAPSSFGSQIVESLGLTRPTAQIDIAGSHGAHSETISEEQLDVIDADWIFVGYLSPEGEATLDSTLQEPLVQALSAVKEGHVSTVDGAVWTTTGGPLAATTILSNVEAALGNGTVVVTSAE